LLVPEHVDACRSATVGSKLLEGASSGETLTLQSPPS
jgi:hypothetical protein